MASITLTSVEGSSFKYSPISNKFSKIKVQTPLYENEVITTSKKGLTVIDFNDEVIGTVVLAPNTQVILRKSNSDGVRLLSLIRGHIRLYRDKEYEQKKVGVLINIRDNPTAYHGTHYEIQYSESTKLVTSFNSDLKKYKLNKSTVTSKVNKPDTEKTEQLDQELDEDLKFLLENT